MEEKQFREKLAEMTELAKKQQMCISREQLEETFGDMIQNREQEELLLEYFKSRKISVGDKSDLDEFLSMEDKNYIEEYMESLNAIEIMEKEQLVEVILSATAGDVSARHKVLEQFLPQVTELAKLYAGQGTYIEDLIGEGNLALADAVLKLECLEIGETDLAYDEVSGFLGKAMMDAMEKLINEDVDEKNLDEQMVEKVNKVADIADKLSKEMNRKVSPVEVCANSDLTVEEVLEALRFSGNRIDTIEKEDIYGK